MRIRLTKANAIRDAVNRRKELCSVVSCNKMDIIRLFLVRPWKHRKESTMSNKQVAPGTQVVTVKLLAAVDLGPEFEE